jgi:hypothetical protein
MSIPVNPLDKFRSHSIHYILTVASNTEAFQNYLNPGTPDSPGFLSSVSGKKLGEDIGGGVFLLVDSRKTSEFSIANVTFTTLVGASDQYATSTLVNEGLIQIQVVDPSGVGFFNYFRYLVQNKFKSDGTGLAYCLHLIFVGHTDDGKTEHVSTIGIPMIMGGEFNLSEYTTRGAVYDMGFCSQTMGVSKDLAHLSQLPKILTVNFENSLLGTAVRSIENQLNQAARDWYLEHNAISKPADQSGQPKSNTEKDKTTKPGRIVTYMITLPPHWFYYKVTAGNDKTPETIFYGDGTKAAEDQYKQQLEQLQKDNKNTGTFSSQITNNIHDSLHNLFMLCPEVTALANRNSASTDKEIKTWKIHQSVSSNDEQYTIHFDVVEYMTKNPNDKTPKISDSGEVNREGPPRDAKAPEGSIEFDYIFSGHNSDVLDFAIKIDNLIVGLATNSYAPSERGKDITSQTQKKKDNVSKGGAEKTFVAPVGENQVMYLPPSTTNQRTNQVDTSPSNDPMSKQTYKNAQAFHQTLADMHFSMGATSVKIRGNPNLFSNFIVSSSIPVPKFASSVKDYLQNGTQENVDKLSKWEYDINAKTAPKGNGSIVQAHLEHRKVIEKIAEERKFLKETQYAKVNVYGPKEYPFSEETDLPEYKVKLFYDDWYQIISIVHTFSGSDFTQELNLSMLNVYGAFGPKESRDKVNNAN